MRLRATRLTATRSGSAFTPLSLAPAIWLAADTSAIFTAASGGTPTPSGGNVGRWEGLSGNNRHLTQATTANQPLLIANSIGGRHAVRFDGISDSLFNNASGIPANGDFTVICAHRYLSLSISQSAYEPVAELGSSGNNTNSNSGAPILQRIINSDLIGHHHTTIAETNISVNTGPNGLLAPRISMLRINGNVVTVRSNQLTTTSTRSWSNTATLATLKLAGRQQTATSFAHIDIAEVLALPRSLSDAEVAATYAYLSAKYSIAV